MPKWLSEKGLDLFEYSFGKGVRISDATAEAIGDESDKYGIEISVHAPYFTILRPLSKKKPTIPSTI